MTTTDQTDLAIAVAELVEQPNHLLLNLRERLFHAGGQVEKHGKKTKAEAAPSPWNDAAASLYFDIAAAVRGHESALTLLLFRRARYRGDSHLNTVLALGRLPALIAAADPKHPHHRVPKAAARDLLGWPRQVRLYLDEARAGEVPWTKAPGGLRCPHCERPLRLAPGWQTQAEPPLWCRSCPARLEGEADLSRVDRDWPAGAWIAVLNQQTAG